MSTHQPRKRFGQHFLHDRGVINSILHAISPQANDQILEIGPGEGVLTRGLIGQCQHLHAVEIDRDLAAALTDQTLQDPSVTIHLADALKFDICSVIESGQRLRLVGNLPYNISTPLLVHFIRHASCVKDMHLMLQKEVVDRLVASPNNKIFGRLSVLTQMMCDTESLFDIGPGAFRPPPKVWSAIIRVTPKAKPLISIDRIPELEKLTQKVFSQRRKMLRKILQGVISADELEEIGINSSRRPETLELVEFVALLDLMKTKENPA